jgi:hypothetical protein
LDVSADKDATRRLQEEEAKGGGSRVQGRRAATHREMELGVVCNEGARDVGEVVLRVDADEDTATRLQKEEVRRGGEPAQGATMAHKLRGRPSTMWAPTRTRRRRCRRRRSREAAGGAIDVEGDGEAQAAAEPAGDDGAAVAGGSASLRFGDDENKKGRRNVGGVHAREAVAGRLCPCDRSHPTAMHLEVAPRPNPRGRRIIFIFLGK